MSLDPLLEDPIFQRLVVATQLVTGDVDLSSSSTWKTVGGRTLVIKKKEDSLVVNDVPVQNVFKEGKNKVCLLEKLLFIRPEDLEIAVERIKQIV